MAHVAVVYFSGYGHTVRQAEAVQNGAASVDGVEATLIRIDQEGAVTDADWAALAGADAVVFGSPTYMGNVAWQFKKFADASSKAWFVGQWKDKIAGGFTNSASPNGDKANTISYLMTFAMQHSMVWVGTGLMPSSKKDAQRSDVNWLGGFSGALAQSPSDSTPEEGPFESDLETAKLYGARIAGFAKRLKA